MKPKLHKLPSGDWIPIDRVIAIICTTETDTAKPHVLIILNEGKVDVICPTSSDEEAKRVASELGQAVNQFREDYEEVE